MQPECRQLALGFNEAVRAGSGYLRIYKSDGTLFHSIALTDTSQVTFRSTQPARVLINPNIDLLPGTGYYVLIDAGAIEDVAGNDFGGISSTTQFNFTTAGSPPRRHHSAAVERHIASRQRNERRGEYKSRSDLQ